MSKKLVRVTIEVDDHFVRMLNATVSLGGLGNNRDNFKEHTAADVLAVAFLGEARGALEEQIWSQIPHTWRPHIDVIHELRQVKVMENETT